MELSPEVIEACKHEALANVLTSWENLPYEEVLERLEDTEGIVDDEDLLIWEVFENYEAHVIAEAIENLYGSFLKIANLSKEN
jgi:hypothetical protein